MANKFPFTAGEKFIVEMMARNGADMAQIAARLGNRSIRQVSSFCANAGITVTSLVTSLPKGEREAKIMKGAKFEDMGRVYD